VQRSVNAFAKFLLAVWVAARCGMGNPCRAEPAQGSGGLDWNTPEDRVSASIEGWPMRQLLSEIARTTRWQVYVEPEVDRTVVAKFSGFTSAAALRNLLGSLNYALLPQTNASPALYVFKTSLQEATQRVDPTPPGASQDSRLIANELIVALKPGGGASIDDLAAKLGAKIVGRVDDLALFRLRFDDEAAANSALNALRTDPNVSAVEHNQTMERPVPSRSLMSSSAPTPALRLRAAPGGAGVIVGVIDTAVQGGASGLDAFLLPGVEIAGKSTPAPGQLTHGTAMSETILQGVSLAMGQGETTNVRILPVDVYGPNTETTLFQVMAGVHAAANAGASIINLSLSGGSESPMFRRLIQQGRDQGMLFIAAAGNDASQAATYPAAYPEVLAVTAGDRRGNLAHYANFGSFVDVVAPGASVVHYGDQSFFINGTSTSTAYVSGLAAGMASTTKLPLTDVEARLRSQLRLNPPPTPAPRP
jgi:hypothetical protein